MTANKFESMDIRPIVAVEERLAEWSAAERAAVAAEASVRQLSPGLVDIAIRNDAMMLRDKADRLLSSVLRLVDLGAEARQQPDALPTPMPSTGPAGIDPGQQTA